MTERILMSPPDVGTLEEDYVLRALRSGWVAPTGPEVTAFEHEMAQRCDVSEAVALSSGTAALHLALLSVGVRPGDVVIVPTMTFVASANAVAYTSAELCFVDCLEEDGNIDPDLVDRAIEDIRATGRRVAAVMAVDLLGKMVDYRRLTRVTEKHGVRLLEDAAEALGAASSGGPAGSFGDVAALSFNGNKIMTTSGGGMLLSNDTELAAFARFLSTQAREPAVHYEHKHVGYNYRLSNILAAIGRAQLERLDSMIGRRKEIRAVYVDAVADWDGVRVLGSERQQESNCWLTAVIFKTDTCGLTSARVMEHMERRGIECRPLWKPMHLQPVYKGAMAYTSGVAEQLFTEGVTLPSGSVHGPAEIERVRMALQELRGRV